jgi:hypothetical protein
MRDNLRMAWAETDVIRRLTSLAWTFTDVTHNTGDIHAVPSGAYVSLCGIATVWPEEPHRPQWPTLAAITCPWCRDLAELTAAPRPQLGHWLR